MPCSWSMASLMIGVFHTLGQFRRRFGLQWPEPVNLNGMGVMAFGTDPPPLLPACSPGPDPLAVDTHSPMSVFHTMTLATQLLRLVKADLLPAMVNQSIAVCSVVAVKAPDCAFAMHQFRGVLNNVLMHRNQPWLSVLRKRNCLPIMTHDTVLNRIHVEVRQLRLPRFYNRLFRQIIAFCIIINRRHLSHRDCLIIWVTPPENASGGLRAFYIRIAILRHNVLNPLEIRIPLSALEAVCYRGSCSSLLSSRLFLLSLRLKMTDSEDHCTGN